MKVLLFDYNWQKHYSVYCLTSPDGKRYIGISRFAAERRWKNGKGYRGNRRLNADLEKHGFACFRQEVLYRGLEREEAERLEAELIARYDTTDPEKGYNVRDGIVKKEYDVYLLTLPDGKRYVGMTGRTAEKRWDNGRGFKNNAALKAAIDACGFENVQKEHFPYPLSRGSAERIETALIDYFDSANPEKGYNKGHGALRESGWSVTEEAKEKLHLAFQGKEKSGETRKRMRLAHKQKPVRNVTTGEEFPGIREAAEAAGVSPSGIVRACSSRQKTAAGCEWEYLEKAGEGEAGPKLR